MSRAATILIIDDSPEDRHTYKSFLGQYDDCIYTFLEADDADEGLRVLAQARVDLVLLDYQLPDLNGIDMLDRLRDESGRMTVPVVMTTGRGNEEIAVQALKSGAVDYLVKSTVTPANLYRAARNALERGQLTEQLSRETADREEAEAELRDSEARFRLLVESVQDYAIVMLDREGRIDSWNAGARAMFGYHDREIIGQHFRRLFTADDARAKVPERELEEARTLRRSSEDRWHVHKNGTRLWTVGSVAPVLDPSGVHRGYSKILRDVSERRESARKLQEALEVRDEFLAVASHELRTPTTALLLKIQALLRQLERADGESVPAVQMTHALRDANGYVERLRDVLANLLEVASVSTRQVTMKLQILELGALVAHVIQERPDTERAAITLDPGAPVRGTWDLGRLEQVVRHVLGSAVRQAPAAPVRVRVEQRPQHARIVVGVGDVDPAGEEAQNPPELAATTDTAALGLGLYVSRHILQALGGTLRVHRGSQGEARVIVIELATGVPGETAGRTARV